MSSPPRDVCCRIGGGPGARKTDVCCRIGGPGADVCCRIGGGPGGYVFGGGHGGKDSEGDPVPYTDGCMDVNCVST